jgi:hypothetical protein
MSLGKTDSIADALSDRALGPGLKKLITERKVKDKLRGLDPIREGGKVKVKIRELIQRHPGLFADMKAMGKTTEQILEYYHRLQRKG